MDTVTQRRDRITTQGFAELPQELAPIAIADRPDRK
jgi:hypothetical protein